MLYVRPDAASIGYAQRQMCNIEADAPIFVENVKAGIAGRRCYAAFTFSSSSFAVPYLWA
jgi:hypothetical protein